MLRGFAGPQRLVAFFALGCSIVAAASHTAAASTRYTPTVVAGVFQGAGIKLNVYTTAGQGPGTYTWLRPGEKCAGGDIACNTRTTKEQRLFVVVCPSAHDAGRVSAATARIWQTTTVGNVVVAYRTAFLSERPAGLGRAIARLAATR